jgi:hypothetical protein
LTKNAIFNRKGAKSAKKNTKNLLGFQDLTG